MITNFGTKEVKKYFILMLISILCCYVLSTVFWNGFIWLSIIPIVGFLFVLYFFRDPYRDIPQEEDVLIAPADGVITHIEKTEDPGCLEESAIRVSIFLSVLDVHLNRAAYPGRIYYSKYKKGEFLNAMRADSLHRNEYNDLGIETSNSKMKKYCLRQIVGLIARRIVCDVKIDDELTLGQKYGMMKFGSRTDIFIPESTAIDFSVKIGDKVRAGSTVIGRII